MSVAWITGASRGIGRATALALAERGVKLVLVSRPSAALTEVLARVAERGVEVDTLACDLRDSAALEAAARRGLAQHGPPDVVVHNAGIVQRALIPDTTTASFDEQLAVNLRAPFVLTRELLPAMRATGRGRFVAVGSISSTVGTAGAAAYCASKWGLVGFVKSLAAELTDTGLMAAVVLPGGVDTDMLVGSGFPARMTASDVAQVLVHYALDAPLAHNGAVLEMFGT